ncbi:MAG: penicillin acylase family protein [Burkholderiaceae bacterium]
MLGTGAEVLGTGYAALDIGARQLFDPASIKAQLAAISQADRDIFDGYADGFNARIREVLADRANLLPRQFIDAGFDPAPWTGYDVAMIWVGTMANRYSNSSSEVANLQFLNQLIAAKGAAPGRQLFDQLRWLEDTHAPTTVPRSTGYVPVQVVMSSASRSHTLVARNGAAKGRLSTKQSVVLARRARVGAEQFASLRPISDAVMVTDDPIVAASKGMVDPEDRPKASNLWILGPSKTTDGSTILNNGPQFGWVNPAYVFSIGLHGGGYDVTGNTPFAHPVVLFGTNGSISWGATAGPLDVNDMYQERLNPANQNEYFFNGSYQAMKKRTEIVKVKGAADQTVDVMSTVHGTVTSIDVANGTAYSMKRSWDGFEIESLLGWIHSMQAKNWDDWLAQAKRVAITINWYYADAKGNIGYVSPGRLPVRPSSQDIRLPALGDGTMEWQGIRPFTDNPQVLNPSQGFIANWNNQPGPGVTTDGGNYSIVDRVNEFIYRIQAKPKLTPNEAADLLPLTSLADVHQRYFVPYIVAATVGLPTSDPVRQASDVLAAWSGQNTNPGDGPNYVEPGATIMRAWLPLMFRRLLADDLPANIFSRYSSAGYPTSPPGGSLNTAAGAKVLFNALQGSSAGVPQTYDFLNGADKYAMIRAALGEAVGQLTATYGPNVNQWLTPVVAHRFATNNFLGYPQASPTEVLQLPTFMNRGTENDRVTFSSTGTASMCNVAPPGQSGFVAPNGSKTRHYDDQLVLYKNFSCKGEWLTQVEVDNHLESTKTLTLP